MVHANTISDREKSADPRECTIVKMVLCLCEERNVLPVSRETMRCNFSEIRRDWQQMRLF